MNLLFARLTWLVVSWLILSSVCGFAVEPQPNVRTSFATNGTIWVGQRMTFVVELLAPGFFSSAATFDLPDPLGLLVLPPNGHPIVSSEEIEGATYTVQRHELYAFAQRGGQQMIPPITAHFRFRRHPLDEEDTAAIVKSQPIPFTTKLPPGAEKLGSVISARDLKVMETWKPEPGNAKAGDAFTRTITFSAPDTPGMIFPPFPAPSIDGLGVYPKSPAVLDHTDRGSLFGERRDAIVYVCQRPGSFSIPAVSLTWWDLDAKKLRTIKFPERTLTVATNPAVAPQTSDATTQSNVKSLTWRTVAAALLIALALLAAWKFGLHRKLPDLLAPWRPVHLQPLNPASEVSSKTVNPK